MHTEKMIAPIVITVLTILYMIGYLAVCLLVEGIPLFLKVVGLLVFLSLIGTLIFVLVERIKEIKSGDEDDLSNY